MLKKFLIAMALILISTTLLFAEDRVKVQVQFKKGIFACPGGDEIVDFNMGGGNVYEHTCKDGTRLNSFKEYNGIITYTPEEYAKVDSKAQDAAKQALVDKFIYDQKHPVPYVEPSKEDYLKMYSNKIEDAQRSLDEYSKVATAKELEEIKTGLTAAASSVQATIEAKPVSIKEADEETIINK